MNQSSWPLVIKLHFNNRTPLEISCITFMGHLGFHHHYYHLLFNFFLVFIYIMLNNVLYAFLLMYVQYMYIEYDIDVIK